MCGVGSVWARGVVRSLSEGGTVCAGPCESGSAGVGPRVPSRMAPEGPRPGCLPGRDAVQMAVNEQEVRLVGLVGGLWAGDVPMQTGPGARVGAGPKIEVQERDAVSDWCNTNSGEQGSRMAGRKGPVREHDACIRVGHQGAVVAKGTTMMP